MCAVLYIHQSALSAIRLANLHRSYLVGGDPSCLHFSQQGYRARPLLTLTASGDGRGEASDGWRCPLDSHLVEKRQRHAPLTLLGTGVYRGSEAHFIAPNAKRSHLRHNKQLSQERRAGPSCRLQLYSFFVTSTKDGNSLQYPSRTGSDKQNQRHPITLSHTAHSKVHVEDDAHPRKMYIINRTIRPLLQTEDAPCN